MDGQRLYQTAETYAYEGYDGTLHSSRVLPTSRSWRRLWHRGAPCKRLLPRGQQKARSDLTKHKRSRTDCWKACQPSRIWNRLVTDRFPRFDSDTVGLATVSAYVAILPNAPEALDLPMTVSEIVRLEH